MKKWLAGLSITASMLALGACGGDESADNKEDAQKQQESEEQTASEDGGEGQSGGEQASGEQPEMPEPDMEGVPDVVADVNGEEVTKDEFQKTYESQFQQAAMQQQMSGQEVNQDDLKKQVADGMVSQELLIQETDNRGIEAPEEEVNKTIDEIVKQNQLESQDDFFAKMEEQGMKKDEVMSQVETQVKMDQLVAEETGEVEPSDEELKKIYDQQKEQMSQMQGEEGGQEMPSFDEMKPQLKEQVVMQKESEAAQKLAEELKEKSDVTVNI